MLNEKIYFTNSIFNKRLIHDAKYAKNSYNSMSKKKKRLKNELRTLTDIFPRYTDGQLIHEKILNITNNLGKCKLKPQ